MRKQGFVDGVYWEAKVYDTPSQFGINGGRISKLHMRSDGEILANYDRGWDVIPKQEAMEIYQKILAMYE